MPTTPTIRDVALEAGVSRSTVSRVLNGGSLVSPEAAEAVRSAMERTRYVARVVADARERHDEELLAYVDPESLDLDADGDGEPAYE